MTYLFAETPPSSCLLLIDASACELTGSPAWLSPSTLHCLSRLYSFISYWDGDNRISPPSTQESAGREGNPLTLSPPAHNGWVCVSPCDFVIVWVCILARWDQCCFQLRKHYITLQTLHSPAIISLLVHLLSVLVYCLKHFFSQILLVMIILDFISILV